MKKVGKLVRDKIPEIIRKDGREPIISILSGSRLTDALNTKFIEEYNEYLFATDKKDKLEELADILEVVLASAAHLGSSTDELLELCNKKRKIRGGFTKGLYYEGNK